MDRSDAPLDLRRLHVLLVDDDDDSRDVAAGTLAYYGAVVTPASSARSALVRLRRVHPNLVVSDLGMPGVDGFWFLREARKRSLTPSIPIVALTGFDGLRDEVAAAGFDAYLVKPFDLAKFCGALRRLGFEVGGEAVAAPPFSRRFQAMPLMENAYDVRGWPLCPVCADPIFPEDNVAFSDDVMIHGHCALQPAARPPATPVNRRRDDGDGIKSAA
jgi:CheY-like chemotaxis protein